MTTTREVVRVSREPDDLRVTLRWLETAIAEGSRNPLVISRARAIIRPLPDRIETSPEMQDLTEIVAVHDWVRANVRYTRDPVQEELVQTPEVTLKLRHGDCDDHVALVGALLMSIGHPVEVWVCGFGRPQHIYLVARTARGRKVAVDTTLKSSPAGTVSRHPNHWRLDGAFS